MDTTKQQIDRAISMVLKHQAENLRKRNELIRQIRRDELSLWQRIKGIFRKEANGKT